MFDQKQDIRKFIFQISSLKGIEALSSAGGEIFLVGGAVRDFFLKKESKDFDLLVRNLKIDHIEDILSSFGEVMEVGKSFGILKFVPTGWIGEPIDIALPRTEKKVGKGYQGFEVVSDPFLPIEADLFRRDFTINSIAVRMDGKIFDPFNGISDLKNGIIRATSPEAFIEDPLRMLRGIQFASRFGFIIEDITLSLIAQHVLSIKEISSERVIIELDKIFFKGDRLKGLSLLKETGLFKVLFGQEFEGKFIKPDILWSNISRGDFYFVMLQDLHTPDLFFAKNLKGDLVVSKLMKALTLMRNQLSKNQTLFDKRFLLIEMFKSSKDIATSEVAKTFLGSEINDIIRGDMPSGISDLAVTGDILKEKLGYKEGKELGDKLKTLLSDVITEKRKNTLEDLLK